ncbi:glutamate receptor [Trichonephila inaurata madagascariensis]|uniref:Glutamate receptor n=1 Tax=Trichonephila inaurata madagascariensis TaxID=2747483 RepID=A0A8X6YK41_9ARAC|nr:glutamate receptor [Trichonephila inaurata madagascariensis]
MYVDDVEILVPVFEWKLSLFNMLAIFDYQKSPKIDSIQDLVESDVQPVVEFQSSIYGLLGMVDQKFSIRCLKNQPESYSMHLPFKNMSTTGMDLVYSRSFALITDGMSLKHFLFRRDNNHLPCNFRFAKQPLWLLRKVIAFKQTFPDELIHRINHV